MSLEPLRLLAEGNARFVSGECTHVEGITGQRASVAATQRPLAAVVACSDSRVPPELVFDQGLGRLFVVRSAGHVVDDIALGNLEYAVEHLGAPLVLVLGHSRCGAVEAALSGRRPRGHQAAIIDALDKAVSRARTMPGNLVENAMRENVTLCVEAISSSRPVMAKAIAGARLRVVGAVYDLDTGRVEFLTAREARH
jgi:carbonic anhydrase